MQGCEETTENSVDSGHSLDYRKFTEAKAS